MKKRIGYGLPLTYGITLSFFLLLNLSCGNTKPITGGKKDKPITSGDIPPDQLIIWRKPEKTDEEYQEWLARFRKKNGEVNEKNSCGSCDNSLRLLTGPGVKTFIQTNGVDGKVVSGKEPPVTGEDGPIYYSRNYQAKDKKPSIRFISSIERPNIGSSSGKVVKVAVFDTGLMPGELTNYSYKSTADICINGAGSGWNFVDQTRNFSDDDDIKHGTIVTRLITEQVTMYKRNRVEILPVKTHDANGVGDLYNILCAFAYAQKMGVNIINASFGFYVPRRKLSPDDDPFDPNVLLLRNYVAHYLTKNKIILVTAAGNSDNENLKKSFEEHGWPYRPKDPRNLNEVSFFPASLARSRDFPNVIAVTTVYVVNKKGTVSPDQNFSKNVVDIGVVADAALKGEYVFKNPLLNKGETVEGSSFAAPIVTGMLCANYDKINAAISNINFKKEDLWKELGLQIIRSNTDLADKIKDGKIIERLK